MTVDSELRDRLRRRLETLYGERAGTCLEQILAVVERYENPSRGHAEWDERDAVLITYGGQLHAPDATPLATLGKFLRDHALHEAFSTVHILPFFPYSSDDGFSVVDYREVDPDLGSWEDVHALGRRFDLMFDLVLNHVSSRSPWFQGYLEGREPWTRFFVEADPEADLSAVVRPRSSPLLTPFETSRGERHVWTTFSADQVDLNFANPEVLVEMVDILFSYLRHGARILRLDAVAFLWKEIATPSINDPRTHEVVKLLRDLTEAFAPGTWILTETNLPHAENVSYFGDGDEAHMVYQFSLPPLLLDAALTGDTSVLAGWLERLSPPPPGTTFFNFTASHDGVGVRPLEGLVGGERLERLLEAVRGRGGEVSVRRREDGTDVPYELNVSYFDAVGESHFLATQAVMLGLQGIPGVYFHSLVGTPNDHEGLAATGRARSINRRRYDLQELEEILARPDSAQAHTFGGYRRMLRIRARQPAFRPDAEQAVLPAGDDGVLAFLRTETDGDQEILVAVNFSDETRSVELPSDIRAVCDLLSGDTVSPAASHLPLEAGQAVWLELVR